MPGVSVSASDGAAVVTLDRPETHNAFDDALIADLTSVLNEAGSDPAVRAIVLRGSGRSFCAGADLGWMRRMAGYSREENLADSWALQRLFATLAGSPKVTIARVHGAAIGGGAGLVAAVDVAVAAQEATFAFTEVRLGLVPAVISPFVVRKIGLGAARALFVTGERFDAETALRLGLVHRVVAADQLDGAVESVLQSVLSTGPEAVRAAKRLLDQIEGQTPEDAAAYTVELIADLRVGGEAQERMGQFLSRKAGE